QAAKKESDEAVQFLILHALSQFRQPRLEKDSMAFMLGNEFDVHQSLAALLGFGSFAPGDRDVAYDFIKQNWNALMAKLPSDSGAILPRVAAIYCDTQHRADAEEFFRTRATQFSGGPRNLAQALETISICEANKKANQPSVAEFLSRY
ncbi:MAG: ERAP1-like C-terminal domain-containing protein, partial [Acidobacteria bacterium]|nr:ERAP1-like C-terminal domain-containing protein [Acidobacteriota bacterium]